MHQLFKGATWSVRVSLQISLIQLSHGKRNYSHVPTCLGLLPCYNPSKQGSQTNKAFFSLTNANLIINCHLTLLSLPPSLPLQVPPAQISTTLITFYSQRFSVILLSRSLTIYYSGSKCERALMKPTYPNTTNRYRAIRSRFPFLKGFFP